MIVKNPTDSEISIQYKGVTYSVPANGESRVPAEVATYWKTKIHAFVELSEESNPVVETPVVTEAPVVVETSVVEKTPVAETVVTKTSAAKKTAKK